MNNDKNFTGLPAWSKMRKSDAATTNTEFRESKSFAETFHNQFRHESGATAAIASCT